MGGRDGRTRITMSTAASPNVARIPGGDFLMGAADAEEDERPVHRVFVSEFFIGRFPVTNDEYARFVRTTGHRAPGVRELPLVAGGGRGALFRDMAAPYEWHGDQPPAGHRWQPRALHSNDDAAANCPMAADASE